MQEGLFEPPVVPNEVDAPTSAFLLARAAGVTFV